MTNIDKETIEIARWYAEKTPKQRQLFKLLVQNFEPDKRDQGDLIKAEIEKVDAEIDALLLEMSGE